MTATSDDQTQSTERRSAPDRRHNRRREQRQLRAIVEQLADGIVIVGADGDIRFVNPAAEQLFGRPEQELLDTPFGFPVANGEPAPIDVVRPGNATVAAELRVVDITWEGKPARLVSIRDVTERRRAQERAFQLERERAARAEAEAANQAKSELLATMSHELRTPLNAVLGYAELLDLGIGGPLAPQQRHQIERIRASGRHLLGLVNQILDLAKIDAGRLAIDCRPCSARTTADAAIALLLPVAESRGVAFVDRSVHDPRVRYLGDEDRVRQILVNLLTNAVKFTDAGGTVTLEYGRTATADVDARLPGAGPWTWFRVRDTGMGIPVDHLSRIFQPFFQVESGHTRTKDGSGLGLTISRRLARLMRGDITVRSKPDEGSEFTVWLPAPDEAPTDGLEGTALPAKVETHASGLAEVGEILLRETEPLLEAFVSRLRGECPTPGAGTLKFSQLADHVACYIADLGGMLIALDESGSHPSAILTDAADIHRLLASRHGAQRARLGWNEAALGCEYEILRDEIQRVVRKGARSLDPAVLDEAIGIVNRFLEEAEETSARALARSTNASTAG